VERRSKVGGSPPLVPEATTLSADPIYVLGLTTLGDAAATLIRDGQVVAAVEEERFSRRKHHSGFPFEAVQYCLNEGGISIGDVQHVSLYWKPWILSHKAI